MRILLALILGGTLAVVGCGDSGGGAAGSGGAGGTGGTGGSGGAAGTGGSGGMGGGGASPVITEISWAPVSGCGGNPSMYTITVTVEDSDSNVPGDITYDGSVSGCQDGTIDAEVSTVTCPNAAPYQSRVVVEDDTGNFSDEVMFTLPNTCTAGSHTP